MKLKIRNLNRLMKSLSGRAVDLYLYLVKRQDKIGSVKGIYYKTVMKELHMPRSTFYASLHALEEGEFIGISQVNQVSYNIFIFDNIFTSKSDFKEGYVNLNMEFVLSKDFICLKVRVKKFFLRMMGLQANVKPVKMLNDTLKDYQVYKRLEELKELFNVQAHGDGYVFQIREDILKAPNKHSGDHLEYRQKVIDYCRSFNIRYTEKELIDTYKTITTHMRKNRLTFIIKAFDTILKKKRLQPKLISYLCGQAY